MSVATIQREFAVSAQRLYEALANQDILGSWLGVKVSVPVRAPSGLVGTVRRIHLGPVTFDERIEVADASRAIEYAVVPPMPLLKHHRGEMRIEPLGPSRSRLTWKVALDLTLGLDLVVLPFVKQSLSIGLSRLSKRLAS